MKKYSSIKIGKEELLKWILLQGDTTVPPNANIFWHGISHTLEVSWDEGQIPYHLRATLSDSTTERVVEFVSRNSRIEAIKAIREETKWGLKESKDWLDFNHPGTATYR